MGAGVDGAQPTQAHRRAVTGEGGRGTGRDSGPPAPAAAQAAGSGTSYGVTLLAGPGVPVGGTGVRHVRIDHRDASNRSPDEAAWIAGAVEDLIGRSWQDKKGNRHQLTIDDVLVVAPYNAQVAEIARQVEARIGMRANVGTVDKFQGREAPVAIYSMTTSTPDDAPRALEFLYSGNRLNVAISRARGLAVLIANPALLIVACRTPEQMRLLNVLCRFVEIAQPVDGSLGPPAEVEVAAD